MEGQDIMLLFEGVNPYHPENPVKIVHIGGTQRWLDEHQWQVGEDVTISAWTPQHPRDSQGAVEFQDTVTGKKFWVEQNNSGDWN